MRGRVFVKRKQAKAHERCEMLQTAFSNATPAKAVPLRAFRLRFLVFGNFRHSPEPYALLMPRW